MSISTSSFLFLFVSFVSLSHLCGAEGRLWHHSDAKTVTTPKFLHSLHKTKDTESHYYVDRRTIRTIRVCHKKHGVRHCFLKRCVGDKRRVCRKLTGHGSKKHYVRYLVDRHVVSVIRTCKQKHGLRFCHFSRCVGEQQKVCRKIGGSHHITKRSSVAKNLYTRNYVFHVKSQCAYVAGKKLCRNVTCHTQKGVEVCPPSQNKRSFAAPYTVEKRSGGIRKVCREKLPGVKICSLRKCVRGYCTRVGNKVKGTAVTVKVLSKRVCYKDTQICTRTRR